MKNKLIAIVAALTFMLSACSTPSYPDAKDDQNTQSQTVEKQEAPKKLDLPDPHQLTGLSEVPDIPDPEPIAGEFTQTLPVTVTDAENNSVTITDTTRILALDLPGTISRTVISLGYGDKLIGRTVSSTEKQLADLPVVTENGHSLNTEAILSLKPTVILIDRSVGPPEAVDQLRSSGIPVVIIDSARGIKQNTPLIMSIAQALGVEDAGKALADRTEKETADALAQIKEWTPEKPLEAAFLYVRGTGGVFFILGENEGATELIRAVGAKDLASENGITGLTPANAESLVKLNPEVIFTMTQGLESTDGMEGFLARPGVTQTRAGQNQRVVTIPDGLSLSFGPQTGQTLLAIARALYGVK